MTGVGHLESRGFFDLSEKPSRPEERDRAPWKFPSMCELRVRALSDKVEGAGMGGTDKLVLVAQWNRRADAGGPISQLVHPPTDLSQAYRYDATPDRTN
jgi:hypothetical protein